ncbi:MAG: phytoene/squalene synthase family protein [Chlorobia bacterium]|nr:phytoene/squalene synthase family protein [Fimbriimonadaceae bacterium]
MGIAIKEAKSEFGFEGAFASSADFAICRRIHRQHGTTYYFASKKFRPEIRKRTHALYGFVRTPDEWVDNPNDLSLEQRANYLRDWRAQLLRGMDGVMPEHPVMRAFCDVVCETEMPLEEPLCFLDAMEQDLSTGRYDTYLDLRGYMRGSAAAVGLMMCHILGAPRTAKIERSVYALGEAMQLTNFLRDVSEDARRGRIYLPLEDLATFSVSEDDVLAGRMTEEFKTLMRFEIARARALYAEADTGIPLLPRDTQKPVLLARILYSKILGKIEERDFDVFGGRARTGKVDKLRTAFHVLVRGLSTIKKTQ